MAIKRKGSRPLSVADLRDLVATGQTWVGLGRVYKPADEDKHYSIEDGDVLVDVLLMPDGQPLFARLGGAAGGPGYGVWRIPPPDTEVALLFPGGALDSDCMIVAVLASQTAPAGLDGDTLVITNPKNLTIESTGGDVNIKADGKVKLQEGGNGIARKNDKTKNGTLLFVPGTGGAALTYVPPGGTVTVPAGGSSIALQGLIDEASTKAECG